MLIQARINFELFKLVIFKRIMKKRYLINSLKYEMRHRTKISHAYVKLGVFAFL